MYLTSNLSLNVVGGLFIGFTPNTLQTLWASICSLGMSYALTTLSVFMRHRAGCTTVLPWLRMGGNILRSSSSSPWRFRVFQLSAANAVDYVIPTHLITTHWSYHYLLAWLLPPQLITTYSNQLPILRHAHPALPKSPVPNLDMLHKKAQGCVMSMEDVLHNQVHHRGVLSSGLPPPLPFAKVPTISGPVFHYHGRWDSPPLFICHIVR